MEDYKIKQIIENILKSQCKKKVCLILDKSDIYVDEVYKILKKQEDVIYEYIESENCLSCNDLDKIRSIGTKLKHEEEIENTIENSDLLIVPFLTKNTLAKVSLGISDDIITSYIQLAIMMNKNILALDISWNPNSEHSKIKGINLNKPYNNLLLNYKNTIESFGVKSISIFELDNHIKYFVYNKNVKTEFDLNDKIELDKKYITMKDIEGKEILHIGKNSKLTNLAQEYVVQNNIDIVQK